MPIEIKQLNYVYSPKTPFQKVALKDINLTINEGEFFGIIGHTGSGKSTLVAHLNALTKIQCGKIIIDDELELSGKLNAKTLIDGTKPSKEEKRLLKEIKKESKKKKDYRAIRARVGMVFQFPEYQLFDETVYKDVEFGCKNLGIPEEQRYERVKQAIEMVGLDFEQLKDRSPFELSGGQKRRVALAGVLAMRPKYLILDEPTAGLDPRGKKDILNLIVKIKQDMCPTIIMISHNMDEVSQFCERIGVMADGELKCVLPPKELFSRQDLLQELGIQMPMITALALSLRARGLNVNPSVLTLEQLTQEIMHAKQGEAHV